MRNDSKTRSGDKPAEPSASFPLFAHANGQWCEKIRSRNYYFGPWSDPNAALARYLDEIDYLRAGRTPPADREGLTVGELRDRYLAAKGRQRDAGEIEARTVHDLERSTQQAMTFFGTRRLVADLTAEDFGRFRASLARRLGPVGLWNLIRRTKMMFNWAEDCGLLERPVPPATNSAAPAPARCDCSAPVGRPLSMRPRRSARSWARPEPTRGPRSCWRSTPAWATPTWPACPYPQSIWTGHG